MPLDQILPRAVLTVGSWIQAPQIFGELLSQTHIFVSSHVGVKERLCMSTLVQSTDKPVIGFKRLELRATIKEFISSVEIVEVDNDLQDEMEDSRASP